MQTTATGRATKVKPTMGCAYVVMAILLAGGGGLLVVAEQNYRKFGDRSTAAMIVPLLIGLVLVGFTFVFYRFSKNAVRDSAEEEARRLQFPNQPWKWKKAWLGPAIEAKSGAGAAAFWIFAIFWNAISTPAAWIVAHDPHPKKGAFFVFLFPLIGLGLLSAAFYQTVRWRKFGRTRFVPTSLPGVIGGYLGGLIEVTARVMPEAEARLALRCIRRETRGSGKNRSTRENVLWEHEELIARDKWLTGIGGTQIPVLFYIPATCTATDDSDSNNEVVWRLSADAAVPGVDFSTQIDVPVFATGETAPPPEAGKPLLAEYSGQPLDETALKNCGVRRTIDGFHFSASHLGGTKSTTAVLFLGLVGAMAWYTRVDAPGIVWAITIFFWLIICLFTFSVWFASYELRIDGHDVVVTKPRPWGTKVTRVRRDEVKLVKTDKSMSSGENQYFGLSLVGVDGVDPTRPQGGEPFLVRKLRYQLEQSQKKGRLTPERLKEMEEKIATQFSTQAKFVVPFATHIPGQTKAEAIGAQVLAAIRGGRGKL